MQEDHKHQDFPNFPGVYLFKDKSGAVIYVGKAKLLRNRLSSYFQKNIESEKTKALVSNYETIEYIVTQSELEALLLENKLIKKYKPYYNIQWKDDKNYPYLKLTINDEWPRIIVVRKKENDGALYFGPYEGKSVKDTLRLIKKLFPIRTCKETPLRKRNQPCLQYHIKRCWGPCIGKVSNDQYRNLARAIASILSGDMDQTINALKLEMKQAASEKNYEQAARLRNKINGLERMRRAKPSWVPQRRAFSPDIILLELQKELSLPKMPKRIEAFDVSNTSGTETVASMVTFEHGIAKKSDYRKFIIKSVKGPNDVASIYEAVYRRYAKSLSKTLPLPDLVLIDGGIPQVNMAKQAQNAAKINIPMIGLAKKQEEIFFPRKRKPIILSKESKALQLLQNIRDEAHRFAVTFHKKRRSKASGYSV